MALNRIPCPECGAGVKSASGFTVGQSVCCPKCETYFTVEEPAEESDAKKPVKAARVAEDDDDALPRKKRRRSEDDEEEEPEYSYKNSLTRYAILAILIAVMIALGVMLYLKKKREAEESSDAPRQPVPTSTLRLDAPRRTAISSPSSRRGYPAPAHRHFAPSCPTRPRRQSAPPWRRRAARPPRAPRTASTPSRRRSPRSAASCRSSRRAVASSPLSAT